MPKRKEKKRKQVIYLRYPKKKFVAFNKKHIGFIWISTRGFTFIARYNKKSHRGCNPLSVLSWKGGARTKI